MARDVADALVAAVCNIAEVRRSSVFFLFNDTATTEIYTLSLHDALPIASRRSRPSSSRVSPSPGTSRPGLSRSEEHTSELQSPDHLVCRLLLEKKKQTHLRYQSRAAVRHVIDADPVHIPQIARTYSCSFL